MAKELRLGNGAKRCKAFSGLFFPGPSFPVFDYGFQKRCKGVHCVDLGESFPTHIFLQNLASIQPRTSLVKFSRSPRTDPPGSPVDRAQAYLLGEGAISTIFGAVLKRSISNAEFGSMVWNSVKVALVSTKLIMVSAELERTEQKASC